MSQESISNSGVRLGHAASCTTNDAACADDLQVLVRGAALVCIALSLLVLNAPTFWPHLFAH
jgi:hypothetical protein